MRAHPPEPNRTSPSHRPESGRWDEATDHLWRTLEVTGEWTRFVDAKAAAVLTANGVLGTLAAALVEKQWSFLTGNPGFKWVALLCGLALLASSIACVKCLFPKVRVKGEYRSLLFFHHIALSETPEDYLSRARSLAEPDVAFREIGTQVWAISQVAREKHQEVALAIAFTAASLIVALAAWVAAFFTN